LPFFNGGEPERVRVGTRQPADLEDQVNVAVVVQGGLGVRGLAVVDVPEPPAHGDDRVRQADRYRTDRWRMYAVSVAGFARIHRPR
jgi:hypothetical protein